LTPRQRGKRDRASAVPVATPHLAEPLRYTARQIAETIALSPTQVHGFWRALGFAAVDDDAVEFTESDLSVLNHPVQM
jgi:adenylate cyclase